jgi:HPt (histidine-containing phosphotransfer) domain-containing protein
MELSLAAADFRSLQRLAHTLKSSAGQVGAMALSAQAAAMERKLRAGEHCPFADLVLLRSAMARFLEAAGLADDQRVASAFAK